MAAFSRRSSGDSPAPEVTSLETGSIVPKDVAAREAADRLTPAHGRVLERAAAAYRGEIDDRRDDLDAARASAEAMVLMIRAAAADRDGPLPPADASV